MSLITCKECGKEISDQIINCPNCGCPLLEPLDSTSQATNIKSQAPSPSASPSVRNSQKLYKTGRLIIGIISIVLFLIISLQSCAAGVINAISSNESNSGSAGFLLSACMLTAGIVTVVLHNKTSKSAFIVPSCFYIFGALIGILNIGVFSDLQIWSILSVLFGALLLYFLFKVSDTKKIVTFAVPILIVIIIVALSSFGKKADETVSVQSSKNTSNSTKEESNSIQPIVESADNEPAPTDESADTADTNVPKEYKSALNKASDYSEAMHMSKIGIYNQLTSEYGEQFSTEAAQYAIDNINADWEKNALESAKNYSTTMHMSKIGVYNQLISEYGEQFTEEEAQYAVDNVEADWKANALESAKNYQDSMDMSPEAIRDQLTSEYGEQFTQEEADYAISNLE